MPPRAAYLMWSALAAFGITWIAVWLAADPRSQASRLHAVELMLLAIVVVGLLGGFGPIRPCSAATAVRSARSLGTLKGDPNTSAG